MPKLPERVLVGFVAIGDHRADAAGRREQGGGLRADDLEVGVFAGLRIVDRGELQHLALDDDRRGFGQDAQHVQRAVIDHQLKGTGEQEIAHQDAGLVAEDVVGRCLAASEAALIDHVVMQQGRGVQQLDRCRQTDMPVFGVAAHPGAGESEHRPQALAAGCDDVACQLRDQLNRAFHAAQDGVVDRQQIVGDERAQPVERIGRARGLQVGWSGGCRHALVSMSGR